MIDQNTVQEWLDSKKAAQEAAKKERELYARVFEGVKDEGEAVFDIGVVKVQEVKSSRLDAKQLRADMPDIAKKYTKETESFRMTFKPAE